jgi:hypothetical protein
MASWTVESVKALLMNNNRAVEKAIVAIYNRQTLDEQSSKETKYSNGIGFSGAHSRVGTYYAQWILSGRPLSGKHLEKARAISLRYTGQLLSIIENKA